MLAGFSVRAAPAILLLVTAACFKPPDLGAQDKAPPSPPVIQAYFGPKAADDPSGVYFNMIRFLDSARTSIRGALHEVDMVSIAEKLAEKAEEGVDVQIVIETKWWNISKNKAGRGVLEKSKVKVILDSKKAGLMHNKFFVVDGKRVWTGSTNITETCLLFNPNNALWIEDPAIAANFLAKFDREARGLVGKKSGGSTAVPHPIVETPMGRVRTLFSPEDQPLAPIVKLIDAAQKSVDILCFVFSSRDIGEAVIRAHRRGVKVRVLLDNSFAPPAATGNWTYVPFRALSDAGVNCKYDDEKAKLHHKLVIVDDAILEVGSMNLSLNGEKTNSENVLIIESPELAHQYTAEFERLWKYFEGQPGDDILEKEDENG